MTGRRYRTASTNAELKHDAREWISNYDGMDRARAAFLYLSSAATDEDVCYSNAQLAAIAKGLMQGMREGVR